MARRIFLERSAIENTTIGTFIGWRLRVEAHDAEDMPNEIFVYRVGTVDPNTQEQKATFQNVATPADLEELPANGPTEGQPLLFRLDVIDVVFRSPVDLESSWDLIQEDVRLLVSTLNQLDELEVQEDVLIGAEEEESSSG